MSLQSLSGIHSCNESAGLAQCRWISQNQSQRYCVVMLVCLIASSRRSALCKYEPILSFIPGPSSASQLYSLSKPVVKPANATRWHIRRRTKSVERLWVLCGKHRFQNVRLPDNIVVVVVTYDRFEDTA